MLYLFRNGVNLMSRRTLEERIAAAQTKKQQEVNNLNRLLKEQKEKERAARTNRLCKRAGLLESMLPDTILLTDELFEQFLKRTTANDFGRKTLGEFVAKIEKPVTAPQGEPLTERKMLIHKAFSLVYQPNATPIFLSNFAD